MVKKRYQIKIYSSANVYLETINPSEIISNIAFTSTLNSWQGNITIKVNTPFNTTIYSQWNLIKITLYDTNYPTGKQVYFWFINAIKRTQTITAQYIELTCVWIFGLLNNVLFKQTSFNFTKNQDPAQTIKDIIDYFNTQYPWNLISYSWGWVINYWSSINLSFSYESCFSALQKCMSGTNYSWYIWPTWQIFFKPRPPSISHYFTNQYDVEQVTINDDIQETVNKYYLERNWGVIQTYQDIWSQTLYGIKEKKDTKSDIQDWTSQDTAGNNYIARNKVSRKETQIVINSKYRMEDIVPWDTIKVKNFEYLIDWLQVLSVNYWPTKTTISLEKITSFAGLVTDSIEN